MTNGNTGTHTLSFINKDYQKQETRRIHDIILISEGIIPLPQQNFAECVTDDYQNSSTATDQNSHSDSRLL